MPNELSPEERRKSVLTSYLTPEEKQNAASLALAAGMTQSDLVRLWVVTEAVEDIERRKRHPAYLALLAEEENTR